MIKAVIFDLDNTLVDFMLLKNNAVEAAIHAMVDAGLDMSYEDARKKIDEIYDREGMEYQQVFDKFLEDYYGNVDHRIMSAGIVAYRKAREAALKPYPRVFPTLIELIKRGIKLAVVTDAPAKEAWLRLSYLNFHHIFDFVVTFDDTRERKPSPAPFNRALELLGFKGEECLMIGDWADKDMVGAKAVGMKTVFARYGDFFETTHPGSDYEIDSISGLLEIIEKENS